MSGTPTNLELFERDDAVAVLIGSHELLREELLILRLITGQHVQVVQKARKLALWKESRGRASRRVKPKL